MALLKAGYWQTTYWPSNYWQEDYWPEYGTAVPAPAVTVGDAWLTTRKPPFPRQILLYIRDYLSLEEKQNG